MDPFPALLLLKLPYLGKIEFQLRGEAYHQVFYMLIASLTILAEKEGCAAGVLFFQTFPWDNKHQLFAQCR